MSESQNCVFKCKNLTKSFKTGLRNTPVEALKDVSLNVPKGVVCGLLGPNGSGKSTLMKLAMDLIHPTSGEVSFFDNQKFKDVKNRVSFVPEKPEYTSHHTAEEVLRFYADLLNISYKRVDKVLELVGMEFARKRKFGGFSKGMKQRLAIARSLLGEPDFLILDEPLSGLDPDGREALIQVIEHFAKEEHKTVMLSSHLLDDIQRVCDYLVILKEGELLFEGNPYHVVHSAKFDLMFRSESGEVFSEKSVAADLSATLDRIMKDTSVQLVSIQPERQPLNDLYFQLTHKSQQSLKESHKNI